MPAGSQQLMVDCELPLHALRDDHYDTLASLEPYGPGFAEPTFLATRVRVVSVRRSGLGRANLRLRLQSGVQLRDAVWSKRGDLEDALRPALRSLPPLDVVYQLSRFVRADTGVTEWLVRVLAMRPAD
jgi:single-stranded DNA-specific DHH superfamily exonuclease